MVNSTVSLANPLRRTTVVIVIAICLISAVRLSTMAQLRVSSTNSPSGNLKPPSLPELLLVFHGYPQIGVPRSGIATVTDAVLSNIHDATFLRVGGELSPDGRLIAYDNCAALNHGIYVVETDGRNATEVLPISGRSCVTPRWSPDGTKLSYSGGPDFQLHVMDIADKQEEVLANTNLAGWHSWSPAGDEIVYESGTGWTGRLLYVTDLHGNSRQITFARDFQSCDWAHNVIDTWAPDWSPKGDKISFTQCGSLFVISPSGAELQQLTSISYASPTSALPITPVYSPRWSPDGRWIFFIGEVFVRGGSQPLKRMSPDDKVVVNVGTLPYPGGPFSIGPLRR